MIDFSKIRKIYFIGIKGSGMVALVEIFGRLGFEVTGSDTAEKFFTDEILKKKLFVKYHEGFDENHITGDIDLVIYSTAYNEKNNNCNYYTTQRHACNFLENPFLRISCLPDEKKKGK